MLYVAFCVWPLTCHVFEAQPHCNRGQNSIPFRGRVTVRCVIDHVCYGHLATGRNAAPNKVYTDAFNALGYALERHCWVTCKFEAPADRVHSSCPGWWRVCSGCLPGGPPCCAAPATSALPGAQGQGHRRPCWSPPCPPQGCAPIPRGPAPKPRDPAVSQDSHEAGSTG